MGDAGQRSPTRTEIEFRRSSTADVRSDSEWEGSTTSAGPTPSRVNGFFADLDSRCEVGRETAGPDGDQGRSKWRMDMV